MKINDIQDQIIAEFSGLEDWFDTYTHLIDLGKGLDPMPDAYKTDENAVSGCQSESWVYGMVKDGKMKFHADSDTMITKGIIALVLRVVNEQAPRDIVGAQLYFIDKIGLASNLSPARSNGMQAIITHIKERAQDSS